MHTLWKDTLYALRMLVRNPGFAIAAVLTLALGIGANTAIFSVVHGVLLRPLPYPDADRLYVVWNENTREGIERDVTSYPNFQDWRDRSDVFEAMAAFSGSNISLSGDGDPEQARAALVSAGFFDVLGARPVLGPGFDEVAIDAGATDVVLIGDALWRSRFGADPSIIGRDIIVNGTSRTVVGVLGPEFAYPEDAQAWLPLAPPANLAQARGALWLSVIGRTRAGADHRLAQDRMNAVAAQLAEEYPGANTGAGIMLEPLQTTMVGAVRTPLLVLLGAVAVVLLIGCANVANLLLARGAVRRKELAVRTALGAGRARMARQLLTESVVLAVAGGVAGTVLAVWSVSAIVALAPAELPRVDAIRIDATVLGFALLVSVVTGLLFGLAPLLQSGRVDVMSTLRDGGREAVGGGAVGRLRPALVSGEVGLALVLLVAAGLLIRSFAALTAVEPGFDPRGAATFRVVLPGARYETDDRITAFQSALLERVRALPGVSSAGAANTLFLSRLPNMAPIAREGDAPVADEAPRESVVIARVTPGFLDAMGMRLLSGRDIASSDGMDGVPVAVVNESFVSRYFPDSEPIGRRFTFGDPQDENATWREIVGVAADARRSGLDMPPRPEAFLPHVQATAAGLTFVARSDRDPMSIIPAVRTIVREMDPQLPISEVGTLEQSIAAQLAARRFVMTLLAAFAALAALLAAIGIYGVVSYLVAQRTHELGLRLALGASRADLLRLVLRQSLYQLLPGIAIGVVAALALTRVMASQLYGVSTTDPLTFAAVTLSLIAVGTLASYVPARRAAAVEPITALRQE
jgi:putative ABC transport system permease protein